MALVQVPVLTSPGLPQLQLDIAEEGTLPVLGFAWLILMGEGGRGRVEIANLHVYLINTVQRGKNYGSPVALCLLLLKSGISCRSFIVNVSLSYRWLPGKWTSMPTHVGTRGISGSPPSP